MPAHGCRRSSRPEPDPKLNGAAAPEHCRHQRRNECQSCNRSRPAAAIAYATHDGVTLQGDLYLPAGPGPFPALVAVHGGGWQAGARNAFQFFGPWLAQRGYAAIRDHLSPRQEGPEDVSAGGQRRARGRAIRARQVPGRSRSIPSASAFSAPPPARTWPRSPRSAAAASSSRAPIRRMLMPR